MSLFTLICLLLCPSYLPFSYSSYSSFLFLLFSFIPHSLSDSASSYGSHLFFYLYSFWLAHLHSFVFSFTLAISLSPIPPIPPSYFCFSHPFLKLFLILPLHTVSTSSFTSISSGYLIYTHLFTPLPQLSPFLLFLLFSFLFLLFSLIPHTLSDSSSPPYGFQVLIYLAGLPSSRQPSPSPLLLLSLPTVITSVFFLFLCTDCFLYFSFPFYCCFSCTPFERVSSLGLSLSSTPLFSFLKVPDSPFFLLFYFSSTFLPFLLF